MCNVGRFLGTKFESRRMPTVRFLSKRARAFVPRGEHFNREHCARRNSEAALLVLEETRSGARERRRDEGKKRARPPPSSLSLRRERLSTRKLFQSGRTIPLDI